ncbi:hypothetical protein BRD00_00355 [Halobacteriales archaeon QS_8_69_26]|nr:MAG: hypothetical protein BRD00_00355 [Halobacteriales archaeon QS_8_69_26]
MSRGIVGPFLLTVAQFAVAIAIFLGVQAIGPSGPWNGDMVAAVTVVFAVTALTWGYWQVTGGGWGISRREYEERKEGMEAANRPQPGNPGARDEGSGDGTGTGESGDDRSGREH